VRLLIFLLFCSVFMLLGNRATSQELDVKYYQVINYLKGQKINTSWNISPVIRCLAIQDYREKLQSDSCCHMIVDSFFTQELLHKLCFEPYRDERINDLPENIKISNAYLTFSHPVSNFLCVELRNGNINFAGLKTPYFGKATSYLFIFDDNNRITKVFTSTMIYN
jgi:hypothetical protein